MRPSAYRQTKLDAVITLSKAGWRSERIAMAINISRATIERVIVEHLRERRLKQIEVGIQLHE